jgi:inorganic pyrophosphatase
MTELPLEERHLAALQLWQQRESENADPPSLAELINAAYPDQPSLDGRSKEARDLKEYLSQYGVKADGAHVYHPKEPPKLTDEHKEFLTNNASTMNATHLGRIIFDDATLTPLHAEIRVVNEFLKTLPSEVVHQDTNDVPEGKYAPPKTFDKTLTSANKYIHNKIDKKKLTGRQKREIDALMGYVNTYRFIHQINTYDNNTHRCLFESSFIRYTYDKPDLTQEEVDQYIVLSTEVVIGSSIQARSERLQQLLDTSAEDTEGRRVAMGLVQAISSAQTEYNQCVGRQHKLLGDLKERRSDKLKSQIKENASVVHLVQMWKEEESRKKLIALAELRKRVVKEEIEKLSSMDEVKARIMGISEDEVLNG